MNIDIAVKLMRLSLKRDLKLANEPKDFSLVYIGKNNELYFVINHKKIPYDNETFDRLIKTYISKAQNSSEENPYTVDMIELNVKDNTKKLVSYIKYSDGSKEIITKEL